jgi:hypothetical protein
MPMTATQTLFGCPVEQRKQACANRQAPYARWAVNPKETKR